MAGSIDRFKGSVKWFDRGRGFGFIAPEGGGQDLFVHQSSIKAAGLPSLTAGEAVEFVVSVGDDGRPSAVSVTGPGGACIQGATYFRGSCFRCKKVGHMARDCKSNDGKRGLDSCYRGGEIGTLIRGFPATQPTDPLNFLKRCSLSPIPDKGETLVDPVLEGMNSEEEEEKEEQSEVSREDNELKSGAEWRNWAELPRDILLIIFKKIPMADILSSAQAVCSPWRQLSHEPALWRCIDLRMYERLDDMVPMVMMAVDRSEGCLEELYMGYFMSDDLMHYIAERATRLHGLHLVSVGIHEETLVETLRKLPMLEELEISRCYCFSYKVLERVGEVCPQLKSFRLDDRVPTFPLYRRCDSRKNVSALAIAKNFKQLRRLRLFSNCLTNIGLLAILDNCPNLEYLDIRYCFNVDFLDENLKNRCAGLKDLRLPNDSVADYEYTIDEVETDGSDITPHLSDTDYDFGYSDDDYYYESSGLGDFDDGSFEDLAL